MGGEKKVGYMALKKSGPYMYNIKNYKIVNISTNIKHIQKYKIHYLFNMFIYIYIYILTRFWHFLDLFFLHIFYIVWTCVWHFSICF